MRRALGRAAFSRRTSRGLVPAAVAASPLAHGLFAVAAAHSSGGCDCFSAETGTELAMQLAEKSDCASTNDVAACLREVPASSLVELPSSGAIADGSVLPQCPQGLFAAGGSNPVPLIFGMIAHEGMLYLNDAARALTWDGFHQLLDDSFGAAADAAIAAVYPTTEPADLVCPALVTGATLTNCNHRLPGKACLDGSLTCLTLSARKSCSSKKTASQFRCGRAQPT